MPLTLVPTDTKVLVALGATKNGGRQRCGIDASMHESAVVPSPHTMRDADLTGLARPCIVGLMPLPAPVSTMMSPSAREAPIADRAVDSFGTVCPGSKGKRRLVTEARAEPRLASARLVQRCGGMLKIHRATSQGPNAYKARI